MLYFVIANKFKQKERFTLKSKKKAELEPNFCFLDFFKNPESNHLINQLIQP